MHAYMVGVSAQLRSFGPQKARPSGWQGVAGWMGGEVRHAPVRDSWLM